MSLKRVTIRRKSDGNYLSREKIDGPLTWTPDPELALEIPHLPGQSKLDLLASVLGEAPDSLEFQPEFEEAHS